MPPSPFSLLAMRSLRSLSAMAMTTLMCGLLATPAFADITGFIGATECAFTETGVNVF